MSAGRKILVSVDKSAASEKAITFTAEQLARSGDQIVLFHVTPVPWSVRETAPEAEIQHVEKETAFIGEKLVPLLKDTPHVVIVEENPGASSADYIAELLIKQADKWQATMIVLGSHHAGLVERLLHGSATQYAIRHSRTPVVVV